MMLKVKLHPEVIKFLESCCTVWVEDGERSYIVNNMQYFPTAEEGVYLAQVLQLMSNDKIE